MNGTDDARLAQAVAQLSDAVSRLTTLVVASRAGARSLGELTIEDEGAAITGLCDDAKRTALTVDHGKVRTQGAQL